MVRGVFAIGFLGKVMVSCPVKECSGGNSDLVNVESGAVKECSDGNSDLDNVELCSEGVFWWELRHEHGGKTKTEKKVKS